MLIEAAKSEGLMKHLSMSLMRHFKIQTVRQVTDSRKWFISALIEVLFHIMELKLNRGEKGDSL